MPRKKRHPNWPYRLTWIAIFASLTFYVGVQTLIVGMTFGQRAYGIDWWIAFVASCLSAVIAVWFLAVGASIGSFLNVVAYRLPLGRHVGGHSACPYCQTLIDGADNLPVLAWIRLRGRCRVCHLPISIQYPLVELSVAIVFLTVYITEFATSGANLPGAESRSFGGGTVRISVTAELVMRLVGYLFTTSGLIAAALIAVRRHPVPLKLYLWTIGPLLAFSLLDPNVVVVPWRDVQPAGPVEARLDVLATFLCGSVAALAAARLLAPWLYPGLDPRLMSSDEPTSMARQFLCATGVAGAVVGWQAAVPLIWFVVVCSLVAGLLLRPFRSRANLGDLTVWVWLGLLVFRSAWSWVVQLQILPNSIPEVGRHVLGAILLAPICVAVRSLAWSLTIEGPNSPKAEPDPDSDSEQQSESNPSEMVDT